MNKKLVKFTAAGVVLLCTAASVFAGSVTEPGETLGIATGQPAPPGFYFFDTTNWGCRNTNPHETCVGFTIPVFFWSTPWKVLGGRLELPLAPLIGAKEDVGDTIHRTDWYNPFLSIKLSWDLGYGWGFSYLLGGYLKVNSPLAFSSNSLNQRFALSYTDNGWNLTSNVVWGIQFSPVTRQPQLSPCPDSPTFGCNPNFLNIDLTGTKKFGKWELGPVGYFSSDLNSLTRGYRKQSQFSMGGLIGYDFGPVTLQSYVTTNVYEKNYGGKDTRAWVRISLSLGNPVGVVKKENQSV